MSILREAFSSDSLIDAWDKVRARNAAPGVDGVTVFGFGRNLDYNLDRIRTQVLSGRYVPDPVLRRHIPKSDGDFRRIGIPTVRDRIAQRALLNALLPRVDHRLHPSSFAYRPGRSVRMAIAEIERMRDQGNGWVARVDVELCFDTIPHAPLLAEIDEWTGEPDVTELVNRWLCAGYIDGAESGIQDAGVPQGDVLSPVLSNIYLDAFDRSISRAGYGFVRYADDALVLCRDRQSAQKAKHVASEALGMLGLAPDTEKTGVLSFAGGFKYLGTLFVRSMALPAIRIERSDGSALYVSGYETSGPPALEVERNGHRVVVRASGGTLTERQLSRLVAKELYLAKRGRGTTVGQALLHAWKEYEAERRNKDEHTAGPSDWAFVA